MKFVEKIGIARQKSKPQFNETEFWGSVARFFRSCKSDGQVKSPIFRLRSSSYDGTSCVAHDALELEPFHRPSLFILIQDYQNKPKYFRTITNFCSVLETSQVIV